MNQPAARFETAFEATRLDYPAGHLALGVSVYADRAHLRSQLVEDALAAGFRLGANGPLRDLLDGPPCGLGEVVLIDVPEVDGAMLAALARIDMRAAHADASLVVSTSISALDDVFGCLDQSGAQILVAPSRAERVIALGRVLAAMPNGRVRELSEEDRLTLFRLTEQVGQMTEAGLLERVEDETDRRRAFITLTDKAADAMARYFVDLGRDASRLV